MSTPEEKVYTYFFECLCKMQPLSEDTKKMLLEESNYMQFPARKLLLEQPSKSKHIYFIAKGVCRTYFTANEKEYVTNIACEGSFLTSYASFLGDGNSCECIESISNMECIAISRAGLNKMINKSSEINKIYKKILETYIVEKEFIQYICRKEDAFNRCSYFMGQRKYKELINRISTMHVASFLHMSTETFCRMRKKILIIN
ncbi:hypothetical protein AwDysgo_14270 [Bacteroidales bacterium]|nr:hypothetical protein AwDysgo_14270 [Bacteroidales bacterium]